MIFCVNLFRLMCVGKLHTHIIKDCKRLQLLLSVVGGEGLLGGNLESLRWFEWYFSFYDICLIWCKKSWFIRPYFGSNNLCNCIQAARETGALKEAKDKLEKRVEELTWRLQIEKRLRVTFIIILLYISNCDFNCWIDYCNFYTNFF